MKQITLNQLRIEINKFNRSQEKYVCKISKIAITFYEKLAGYKLAMCVYSWPIDPAEILREIDVLKKV